MITSNNNNNTKVAYIFKSISEFLENKINNTFKEKFQIVRIKSNNYFRINFICNQRSIQYYFSLKYNNNIKEFFLIARVRILISKILEKYESIQIRDFKVDEESMIKLIEKFFIRVIEILNNKRDY